jgi:hypothetical protein
MEGKPIMTTSSEAIRNLEQASGAVQAAINNIENLIVDHDYQDVAALVAGAAAALLECATLLMQSKDEAAVVALERADDFLDSVWEIIEAEADEE